MGPARIELMGVVLDTNTLVSALLFAGTASGLVSLWQTRRITVLVSRPIVREYLRVLAYLKFRLTAAEIRALIADELLPFVETVQIRKRLRGVARDPADDKFLECAVAGGAAYVVTGDGLRDLRSYRSIRIRTAAEFLNEIQSPTGRATPS